MKKRKAKWIWLRYRKNDPGHNMLVATQRWVHANGGTTIVTGGIGILDEENSFIRGTAGKYRVCIGCLGRKPTKSSTKSNEK